MRVWLLMVLAIFVLLFAADPCLASEESEGPRSIFERTLDLGIWTVVVFLVLVFVLGKFAWKPMLEGLDKRERDIALAVEEAKKAKDEATELRRQIESQRQKAADEIRTMMEEARKNAEQLAEERRAREMAEIAAERERLRREIGVARDQALKEISTYAVNLATIISTMAVRRQLSEEDHRRLVDEALAEMNTAIDNRRRTLRSSA